MLPVYVRPIGAFGRVLISCDGFRKAGGWKNNWSDDLYVIVTVGGDEVAVVMVQP